MACDFCNCLFLGCYDNCCDVPFIINNNPILATQTGTYTIQYIQEGSNTMVAAIDFTIGDAITFPFSWFNFTGEVKFQLILPDNSVYEFNTYDCFSFQKVVTSTPSTSTSVTCNNVTVGEICTICDLLEALNIESQLLLEIRDINQTYLDTPLSELGKETTLQAILTALGGFGGAYALESTLQLVLTQLGNLGLDSTLQSILTALGTGLAQETTLQSVLAALLLSGQEITLQAILTALGPLATEITLSQVLTELQSANSILSGISNDLNTTIYTVLANILSSNTNSEILLNNISYNVATEPTLQNFNNYIQNFIDVQLSTRASEATSQLILAQLDIPLSLLQADIQNVNTSIATSNASLATINNNVSNIAIKLSEPTTSLITPITPTTGLNNGSEALIAANARKGLLITNNTNRTIYVAYGASANTTNSYSFRILSNTFEKVEIGANLDFSFSIVQNTSTGTINVTELN